MTHYPAHNRIYNIKADSLETVNLNTTTQHSVTNSTLSTQNNKKENLNSLSGLLAHYDSDSEHEEQNGQSANIDAKVDDFLQEINQIVPSESNLNVKKQTDSFAWQECFDDSTGYPYYWNTETNVVTWEMPEEYKNWLSKNTNTTQQSKASDKVPAVEQHKVLLGKVEDKVNKPNTETKPPQTNKRVVKKLKKKTRKKSSDSEDEKIVMITSYSEDSSSDSESEIKEEPKKLIVKQESSVIMGPHVEDIPKDSELPNKKEIIENIKEENIDETIILARLRTQAKVLHELGGELPKSLDKSVIAEIPDACKPQSLALVAGYGNDSDLEEESTGSSLFPIPAPENTEITNEHNQSTLFPPTKPIDIKQFETVSNKSQPYTTKESETESLVDSKIFKRKKRLGIAFDVPKRQKTGNDAQDNETSGEERKGFGFQTETNSNPTENKETAKMSFIKAGIAFVKADTLNPTQNEEKKPNLTENEDNIEDFKEVKRIVTEKVNFLGEGKDPVSAVQVMAIQLQTLELAYKAGGLTQKYLYSWLRETFVDLEKLEQDAAPEGWQCQWDRSNKRYFYRNVSTGDWQWEFPVDIVGGGEAMDICTTPPPNEDDESTSEPLPSPPNSSPTPPPPPPPVISHKDKQTTALQTENVQPPIPSAPPPVEVVPPPPPTISVTENQPLPPGVDSPDLPFYASKQTDKESSTKTDTKTNDTLGSELDSFYSDIAMLEATTTAGSGTETTKSDIENVPSPSASVDNSGSDITLKKKKKSKSKLGQGINMKKKAVSTLVEKWKKVQNDYL